MIAVNRIASVALATTWLLAARDVVAAEVRLVGLERLYFEHVTEAGPPSLHPSAVSAALPGQLAGAPRAGDAVRDEDGYEVEVSIADFPVPDPRRGAGIVIRQVRDSSHRIDLVWWALYADGRRRDLWFFSASPERTEGKALANPAIEKVRRAPNGTLAVDVVASMLRPQGAEWTSAWTLVFEETREGLSYRHAEERYGMSRGYDTGDAPAPVTYWTARRIDHRIEVKSVDEVSEAVLDACAADTRETEEVADCVTAKAKVRTSTRSLETPAFIERAGRPLQ
jgi:hypothetical protein